MLIEGVGYDIDWRKFKRGTSFFIPCIANVQARKYIRQVTKRLGFTVATKVVVENGIKGLRVWRI